MEAFKKNSSPEDINKLAQYLSNKVVISGELKAPKSNARFIIKNPATMQEIASVPQCGSDDVNEAVLSAFNAQKDWALNFTNAERGRKMLELADLLDQHQEELARLMTLETGKALRTESRLEVGIFANVFRFYGGLGAEIKGETVPFNNTSITMTLREPIGVVGAIIPWNVPLLLMALKIAPAMVAGNSVVVKSSEDAPLTVLRVAEIANKILPPGVFNLISGDGPETGDLLVKHPQISKVTFTGSVAAGRIVAKNSGEKLIPVTLELGGKSPMIICEDMDLEKAANGAVASMRFTRQGQSCTAASRIFVHEKIFDSFLEKFLSKINALKIGDPMDETTDIGTIISRQQFDRVKEYIEIGKSIKGAIAHECGSIPSDAHLKDGLFIRPTVFTGLDNESKLAREEIFGPVTCLIPWNNFDDVLAMANDSEYGLAATIWTNDYSKAMRAVKSLDAGFVQVNQNAVVQPGLSYGGFKTSGIGKEASLEAMLEHFTRKKTVIFNVA